MLRRFVWRATVEGHQRRGPPRRPRDLGAPLIAADAGHFDAIGAAVDRLLEPVQRFVHRRPGVLGSREAL